MFSVINKTTELYKNYFIKKKKCVIYSIVIYSIVKRYNTGVVMFNFMPLLGLLTF